jgi:hypothetical protein
MLAGPKALIERAIRLRHCVDAVGRCSDLLAIDLRGPE